MATTKKLERLLELYAYRVHAAYPDNTLQWAFEELRRAFANQDAEPSLEVFDAILEQEFKIEFASTLHQYFVDRVVAAIQTLEDIGGPETPADYVRVLEAVKVEIERRIKVAKENA